MQIKRNNCHSIFFPHSLVSFFFVVVFFRSLANSFRVHLLSLSSSPLFNEKKRTEKLYSSNGSSVSLEHSKLFFFFSVSAGVGGVKVKKKNKERREKKTGKKSVACDTHTATWLRIHSFIARRCRRIYLILEELPSFFLKFFFSVTP